MLTKALFACLAVALVAPVAAQDLDLKEREKKIRNIQPTQVYDLLEQVRDEVELLRFEMGKPKHEDPSFVVAGAAPREVFYQAVSLLRKADDLGYEQLGTRGAPVTLPDGPARPGDVYFVLLGALQRIQAIRENYEIQPPVSSPGISRFKRPTDVYNLILEVSAQLNLLLDESLAPQDVYGQVRTASDHVAQLLGRFPETDSPAKLPSFERGKVPADVHGRLVGCFSDLAEIGDLLGIKMLAIERHASERGGIVPSDVYDVATLLVSQLSYINEATGGQPINDAFVDTRKWPSDVYQQAGLLKSQLEALRAQISAQREVLKVARGYK